MRLRHVFLAFAFLALSQAPAAGRPARYDFKCCDVASLRDEGPEPAELYFPPPRPDPVPTPLDLSAQNLADEGSYADVYAILKEENSCSRFFGGPAQAVEAFNQFARQLKKKVLDQRGVAVRMSGSFTTYRNHLTGASYRLFDEAAVNSQGPFYNRGQVSGGSAMRVGRFPADTRQARALILLHELGHLVRRDGGGWALPNDGGDPVLSEQNTRKVEDHCVRQLLTLKD
jgi:hypothetical protein